MRRLPPLGSIQAFVQVARQGSIRAAADTLALSSPALTRRIQSLESFIGTPLFERQHNALQLNARGAVLLAEVSAHLEALSEAIMRTAEDRGTMRIRVAVPSLFGSQRLLPALPFLRELHPNLIVDLDTGMDRASRLTDDIDAAITIASEVSDKLYSSLLERGRIVAVGSRALVRARPRLNHPSGLADVPILLHRDMPGAFDSWKVAAGYPDLRPAQVNYFDSGQLILDAAAAGLGIAFMLQSHLDSTTDGRLVRVFRQSAQSPYAYWFACAPSALDRRGVRIFRDWLVGHFGQEKVQPSKATG